jgi:hypothetical protein
MSRVVHLWEEASPASLQDADRLHERLAGTAAAANPKFAQLSRALIELALASPLQTWVSSTPSARAPAKPSTPYRRGTH